MELLPLDAILVSEERQRQYFDTQKIVELANDILEHDLLHALAITNDNRLVAGERRLRALRHLTELGKSFRYEDQVVEPGYAPCVRVSDRDDTALFAVELSENIQRESLTWREKAAAIAKLHRLRAQQSGRQTYTDTSTELMALTKGKAGVNPQTVAKALTLADFLEDQEVAKATTAEKALRIVFRKTREQRLLRAAERIRGDPSLPHQIVRGDALSELPQLPDDTFDIILTDPPYGIGAHEFGSTFEHHRYEDSYEYWQSLMPIVALQLARVARSKAHAFLFCDITRWLELKGFMEAAGWAVWPRPLIWDKGNAGITPRPLYGPRYCYEAILFASKGQREVVYCAQDVLRYNLPEKLHHAAEKPVDLFVDLLRRVIEPGQLVLDPFIGSGTTFAAANVVGGKVIGIEKDPTYATIAEARMAEGTFYAG